MSSRYERCRFRAKAPWGVIVGFRKLLMLLRKGRFEGRRMRVVALRLT